MRKTTTTILMLVTAVCLFADRGYSEGKSEQSVRVGSFGFIGNTIFTSDTLGQILEPYRGHEYTLTGLRDIAKHVTDYYHERGYFLANVIVPEQEINASDVTLQVLEGRLGKIIVSGNKRYREDFIQKYFAKLRQEGAIQRRSLERALLLLNDLPGLKVTSVLQAGEDKGTTDISIQVEEGPEHEGNLEVNNFGSRFSSRARFSAGEDYFNLSHHGDSLSVRAVSGTSTRNLFFGSANYSTPTDANGTRWSIYVLDGTFGIGKEFTPLNIQGKGTSAGISMTRPILKTQKQSLSAEVGFDVRNSNQDLLSLPSSRDRVRVLRLGVHRNTEDAKGRTFASLFINQGLGEMFGGMKNDDPLSSRFTAKADGRFTKLNLDAAKVLRLSAKSFLIAQLSGQTSSRSLVAGEQMSIGGPDSVRGYPQSESSGDSGIQANIEARFSPKADRIDKFQWVLFLDAASVSVKAPAIGQQKRSNLIGTGFGLRANLSNDISLRADVGFSVGRKPSEGGRAIPYLQLIKKF